MPVLNEEIQDLEFADEVDEIIGKPPSWIVRRGTVMIIVIIAMVLAAAAFIKYPDVIKSKASVVAIGNGEYRVVSRVANDVVYKLRVGQQAVIQYANHGYVKAAIAEIANDTVYLNVDKLIVSEKGDLRIIGERQTLLHRLFFRG